MIASKAILPSVFENNTFPHKNINKRVPVTAGQHIRNILIHFFCHVCTFFSSMFSFYSMDSKPCTNYKVNVFFSKLFCSFIYWNIFLSFFDFLYQPIPIIIIPTIIAVVLIDESGENKQDATIPVPAPVKKSTIDFLYGRLIFDFLYS